MCNGALSGQNLFHGKSTGLGNDENTFRAAGFFSRKVGIRGDAAEE